MRTVRIKVYQFSELSKEAQEKAISQFNDINVDFNWWECTYDDFKSLADTIGVEVDLKKTYFNGFYHQGSGSSFTAYLNVKECLKAIQAEEWKNYAPLATLNFYPVTKNLLRIAPYCSAKIKPTNRESSVNAEVEIDNYNNLCTNVDAQFLEMEDFIQDVADTLNNWLYRTLEKEYEYLTSEAAIIETIQANEYEFTKDGRRF